MLPVLIALMSFFPARPGPSAASQDPAQVVARVGAEEITRDDLRKEVNRLIPETFFHAKVSAQVRRNLTDDALESLVERTLIHLDALDAGLAASEQEIDEEFARTLQKAGPQYGNISPEERQRLREHYRPLVRRRILLDKNEARFEAGLAAPDEATLRALFEQRNEELLTPEEARFLHLHRKVDPSSSAAAAEGIRAEIDSLAARLEAGESFQDLAREHSDDIYAGRGGDMGFVPRGSFVTRPLDDAAFALQDGQTSEVLSTLYGFHLVRRVESRPRRPLRFDEARSDLEQELRAQTRTRSREAWLERLARQHGVQVLLSPEQLVQDEEPVQPPRRGGGFH